ncbi:hypothetical protein ABT352_33245 [Streptosporangium sp. NPDC000563]
MTLGVLICRQRLQVLRPVVRTHVVPVVDMLRVNDHAVLDSMLKYLDV